MDSIIDEKRNRLHQSTMQSLRVRDIIRVIAPGDKVVEIRENFYKVNVSVFRKTAGI